SGAIALSTPVTGTVSAGTATLTLTGTNASNTISGAITNGMGGGNVALAKTGSSVWTLSGNNTYTGGTSVSAGSLVIAARSALPASAVTNNSLGGGGLGGLEIQAGTSMTPVSAGPITGTGALQIDNNGYLRLSSSSGASSQNSLTVSAGSTLDLNNNHIFIN